MNNIYHYVCIVLCIVLISGIISQINAEQSKIPNWIRNNAKWWQQGQILDSEFTKGIEYLIEKKVIIIQSTGGELNTENKIPSWIKNNAGLWANGIISDNDFILGIQYLVNSGIITIKSNENQTQSNSGDQCDHFTTAAEKETCLQQIEYDIKIKNSMQSATSYVIGPVTFYYLGSESQKSNDGKTILTIHFLVRNNGNNEVTMTCQSQDSCNYVLTDGQNKIPYSTNTLVYGSLTLISNNPRFLDWTFYSQINSSKNYSFLVKEPWGSGSIPIKISY
jgi:hypothetical protein